MKLRHVRRRVSTGIQSGTRIALCQPTVAAVRKRPVQRPQTLLSTDEFAALMAVAAGQDPSLTWQA